MNAYGPRRFAVGLSRSQHPRSPLILRGLAADEAWQREVAADCLRSVRDPAQLEAVAAALPTMPTAGQLAALDALSRMTDSDGARAALKLLESADVRVQTAAVGNLVWSGTADDVTAFSGTGEIAPRIRRCAPPP